MVICLRVCPDEYVAQEATWVGYSIKDPSCSVDFVERNVPVRDFTGERIVGLEAIKQELCMDFPDIREGYGRIL